MKPIKKMSSEPLCGAGVMVWCICRSPNGRDRR